jgi:hypothetical protein
MSVKRRLERLEAVREATKPYEIPPDVLLLMKLMDNERRQMEGREQVLPEVRHLGAYREEPRHVLPVHARLPGRPPAWFALQPSSSPHRSLRARYP